MTRVPKVMPAMMRLRRGKFSLAGGVRMGNSLMMAPEPAVLFSVTDTGIGMAQEELDKIFDAFYQVDGSSTREYGGTGLGLSIAKNLVDAHRGTIRVESVVNEGTTFYVTLPETPPDP